MLVAAVITVAAAVVRHYTHDVGMSSHVNAASSWYSVVQQCISERMSDDEMNETTLCETFCCC
jgi:hypothetical protein